jgi:hypothetical protein
LPEEELKQEVDDVPTKENPLHDESFNVFEKDHFKEVDNNRVTQTQ